MNRKLRDTLIALSTSGLLLVVGLLAGNPQPVHSPLAPRSGDIVQADGLADANADATAGEAPNGLRRLAPRRNASSHRKFALPYFSFAQGARGRGG